MFTFDSLFIHLSLQIMDLDLKNLGFNIMKTDYNIRTVFRDGAWSDLEVYSEDTIAMHIGATCLHYGQESFEGLKAFSGKDGRIRLFRHVENARRMAISAKGILLANLPESLFVEAVEKVVVLNKKYVPPYGTGASLYIRPLLIGTGPEVGVRPAKEYTFLVFVILT